MGTSSRRSRRTVPTGAWWLGCRRRGTQAVPGSSSAWPGTMLSGSTWMAAASGSMSLPGGPWTVRCYHPPGHHLVLRPGSSCLPLSCLCLSSVQLVAGLGPPGSIYQPAHVQPASTWLHPPHVQPESTWLHLPSILGPPPSILGPSCIHASTILHPPGPTLHPTSILQPSWVHLEST